MRDDISLTEYIPEFLGGYSEIKAALKAEEPELELIWASAEEVLSNQFIETADEYGISRYEKLMGILPPAAEGLEARRARVRSKWLSSLPYTFKMLVKKLSVLCGGDFQVIKNYDGYTVRVVTHLKLYSELLGLKELLEEMIPANMAIDSFNSTAIRPEGEAAVYTGVGICGRHKRIKREVKVYGLE